MAWCPLLREAFLDPQAGSGTPLGLPVPALPTLGCQHSVTGVSPQACEPRSASPGLPRNKHGQHQAAQV